MSFDARSKERLEALGRTLPKKLPPPEPPPSPSRQKGPSSPVEASGNLQSARHALERENNPADLFRALMKASPDGSVPPHLLERLRELEGQRQPASGGAAPSSSPPKAAKTEGLKTQKAKSQGGVFGSRSAALHGNLDQDLYTAFAQLLLEDDGDL